MNIQNVNLNQLKSVAFSGTKGQKEVVDNDSSRNSNLVPLKYDTAKAYASYGINKSENTVDKKEILLKNVYINITEETDYKDALVSIIRGNGKKTVEAKEGLSDIHNFVLKKYIAILSNLGYPGIASSDPDSSFTGIKGSLNNIESVIAIAKYINLSAVADEKEFEESKNELKNYYKENFGHNKQEHGKPFYDEFNNAKSLDEIYQKLDNISYEDYINYCNDSNKTENNCISLVVPKGFANDKKKIKEIENKIMQNISVSGEYKIEIDN